MTRTKMGPMRRWLTIGSWVGLLLVVGCSKAPEGHESPWWLKLLGVLFAIAIIGIVVGSVVGAIFGTNKLFSKFLTEVCDAKKPGDPQAVWETSTLVEASASAERPSNDGMTTLASVSGQPITSSDYKIAFGALISFLSIVLLAAAPSAAGGSADFGAAGWPLYWAIIFGPYYVIRYWAAPRRGGSSSRIVLLLVSAAIVFGWAYHFGL